MPRSTLGSVAPRAGEPGCARWGRDAGVFQDVGHVRRLVLARMSARDTASFSALLAGGGLAVIRSSHPPATTSSGRNCSRSSGLSSQYEFTTRLSASRLAFRALAA